MRALKLILLLALLIGMSAAAYSLLGRDGPFRREIGITPEETQQAAQAERTERVNPPAFDIVRVEETGEIVAAGTAPPGWTIHLETQQRVIGKVKTDFGGSWVFTPDAPLPEGEHSLGLRASAPDGSREVVASQRVAVSVSGRREPAVVALSEENKPTRVLQSGMSTPEGSRDAPEAVSDTPVTTREVAFSAIDYDDEQGSGQLSLSGVATPGARIALYLDNRFIGSAEAGADGAWRFTLSETLEGGGHALRADHVDMSRGDVLSRAEVSFDPSGLAIADQKSLAGGARVGMTTTPVTEEASELTAERAQRTGTIQSRSEPRAQSSERSGEDRATKRRFLATEGASGDRVASRDTLGSTQSSAPTAEYPRPSEQRPSGAGTPPRQTAVIVRRGDTLWHIAKEHFGSGVRYTQIFRSNREQIRNPHRIYPGQRFELPEQPR